MRDYLQIPLVSPQMAPPDLFDALCATFPEGLRNDAYGPSWSIDLPLDDPRADEVLRLYADRGLRPWVHTFRPRVKGQEFTLDISRRYDDADFTSCRLLGLWPMAQASDFTPRIDDLLRVELFIDGERKWNLKKAEIQSIGPYFGWTIVTDRVKVLLERAGFRRLVLKPTWCMPRKASDDATIHWEGHGEPWWELTSDLILPVMSPRAVVRDNDGNRITNADYSNGCFLRESLDTIDALIDPAEPKYLASDIESLGEFDVALTHETFGIQPHDSGRKTIVSHRFCRFIRDNEIKCNFVPVRLDERPVHQGK